MPQNTIDAGFHPAIYTCLEQCLEFQKEDFSLFLQNLKTCRYVLGIDMSSYLVSVGYASLYAEGLRNLVLLYRSQGTGQQDIPDGGNRKRAFSKLVVGYHRNGSYEIGDDAFGCETVIQGFMQPPTKYALDEPILSPPKATKRSGKALKTRRCVWVDFMKGLLEQIRTTISGNGFFGEKENTLLAIIRPSGDDWDLLAEEYKKVICEATGYEPWQVIIFPRNRSIVECACQLSNEHISPQEGLLLLDAEYDTFHTLYLPAESRSAVEYALPMGGQTVDRILAHYFLEMWFPAEIRAHIQPDFIPGDSFFKEKQSVIECTRFGFLDEVHTFRKTLCAAALQNNLEYRYSFQMGKLPSIEFSASMLEALLRKAIISVHLPLYMMPCNGTQEQKDTWFGFLEKLVTSRIDSLGSAPLTHIFIAGDVGHLIGMEESIEWGVRQSKRNKSEKYRPPLEWKIHFIEQDSDHDWPIFLGAFFQLHRFIKVQGMLYQLPAKLDVTLQNELLSTVADRIVDRLYTVAEVKVKEAVNTWYGLLPKDPNYIPIGLLQVTKSAMQEIHLWDIENDIFEALSDLQKEHQTLYKRQDIITPTLFFTSERRIGDFLNEIGVHDVNRIMDLDIKSISLSCSSNELQKKVTDAICNGIGGFFHSGIFFGEMTMFSVAPFQARKSIQYSFLSLASYYIKRNLKTMILEDLKSSYKENNGFGFADQILIKLVPSINAVLQPF